MLLSELSGVGAKRTHALQSAGIFTVTDLLNYFPRDYDDRSNVKTIAELTPDAVNTIRGTVAHDPESANLQRKGGTNGASAGSFAVTKVIIKDKTGTLELIWFNQPYLSKVFVKGREYIFTGKVREILGRGKSFNGAPTLQMQSPDYEASSNKELSNGRIVPIYTPPKQFTQKTFRALMHQALDVAKNSKKMGVKGASPLVSFDLKSLDLAFLDFLPEIIKNKYDLCDRETAVCNIHFPENDELFLRARKRLVFEELFFMQMALFDIKGAVAAQTGVRFECLDCGKFLSVLGFELTGAQLRVLEDISDNVSGGFKMNRLVQGDVGSGKTAVAFAAAYLALINGFQAALMAPTDVLATQHFFACEKVFSPLGFEVVLLTGALGAKAKREALAKIADGSAGMIIGTHALIQDGVQYHNLGLCITDEQHRFGVNQRVTLTQKGEASHTLVMTATPIPRTLGLILYGDLDISIIDELPPGRQEIKTYCVDSKYRERINEFIRKEVEQGRQAYIICPAIEESESAAQSKTELKNVLNYTENLSAVLPEINIAYLHGRMKSADKQQTMDAFKAGECQVIVATTVIEVGVHVANATLIIIENAERFGLSQLHQLRGRVGRGTEQSYCVLLTDTKNKQTLSRMKAMTQTTDGFKLAELDLKQRGAGDFFGTRQHGIPTFAIANLYRDMKILEAAQEAAQKIREIPLPPHEAELLRKRVSHQQAEISL